MSHYLCDNIHKPVDMIMVNESKDLLCWDASSSPALSSSLRSALRILWCPFAFGTITFILKMFTGDQEFIPQEECFQERGPTVSFSNLHYSIQETRCCRNTGLEKQILKDVR